MGDDIMRSPSLYAHVRSVRGTFCESMHNMQAAVLLMATWKYVMCQVLSVDWIMSSSLSKFFSEAFCHVPRDAALGNPMSVAILCIIPSTPTLVETAAFSPRFLVVYLHLHGVCVLARIGVVATLKSILPLQTVGSVGRPSPAQQLVFFLVYFLHAYFLRKRAKTVNKNVTTPEYQVLRIILQAALLFSTTTCTLFCCDSKSLSRLGACLGGQAIEQVQNSSTRTECW